MQKLLSILGISGALLMAGIAQAQETPPPAPAPGAETTVTTTTETTTGAPAEPDMVVGSDPGTMPATGGAPIAMALAGTLTAAGAFFLRRKLS